MQPVIGANASINSSCAHPFPSGNCGAFDCLVRPVAGREAGRARTPPPPEIFRFELNSATKVEFSFKIDRNKIDRNVPMTIPGLGLLDFIGFLKGPPV